MPAPSRRNVGASLTDAIATSRHTDHIQGGGDRHVASRARHDEKWAEAVSVLERRAEQVRTDYERAGHLARFSDSVRRGTSTPPPPPMLMPPPLVVLGRFTLDCIDCDAVMRFHSAKARVPLCTDCTIKRRTPRKPKR